SRKSAAMSSPASPMKPIGASALSVSTQSSSASSLRASRTRGRSAPMSASVRKSCVARTERSHSATSVSWSAARARRISRTSFIERLSLGRQAERVFEGALRLRADRLCRWRAVLEEDDVRDRLDAVAFGEARLLVVVDLDELELALGGDSLEHG